MIHTENKKTMKTLILLTALIFIKSFSASTQTKVVKGYVTTLNDLSVSNMRITAKKAGSAVLTDSLGYFTLVTRDKDILQITSREKVFNAKKVRINRRTPDPLMVQIKFLNTPENREIAVGYGYIKESQLTSAVSQMDGNRENFCHYTDIFELIKGRIPGVQVVNSGREPEVIIRGISSLNASNAALFVLDGMVVNSIAHIRPCEVKRISVLKDSSASMYGSRGSNGVVLIETLKGGDR